jgi:hypothetical protein
LLGLQGIVCPHAATAPVHCVPHAFVGIVQQVSFIVLQICPAAQ